MHNRMSVDTASVSSYTRAHLYHFCLGWQVGVHRLSSLEDLEVFSIVVLQVVSRSCVLALYPTLESEMLCAFVLKQKHQIAQGPKISRDRSIYFDLRSKQIQFAYRL